MPLKLEEMLIAAAMAAMALITFGNVVVRYLTNVSFAFTEEYSVVLMVVVTMVGSSLAIATGRHIRIGVLIDGMTPARWRWCEIAALALVIVCFGLLLVHGGRLAWDEYRFEVLSPGLGNPQWIYSGMLPLLSIAVIARAAGRIMRLARGEDA
ncbi:MAG: TRAP transporter small permease [Phreatobacter sp.]|uniref:TRAP transporter small permease n=1 Tax=Phreatobacter sp. TaxID=1966341 RepID=UPI0027374F7E|nr:TRAP transporter small permease [Phreatobacter sp.]MDP2802753.1 TRAP transporter small permease [Phreatobacter sp.]